MARKRPDWDMDRRKRSLRDPRNWSSPDAYPPQSERPPKKPDEYWVFQRQRERSRPAKEAAEDLRPPAPDQAPQRLPTPPTPRRLARRMQLAVANRDLLLGGRIHTAGDVAAFL